MADASPPSIGERPRDNGARSPGYQSGRGALTDRLLAMQFATMLLLSPLFMLMSMMAQKMPSLLFGVVKLKNGWD